MQAVTRLDLPEQHESHAIFVHPSAALFYGSPGAHMNLGRSNGVTWSKETGPEPSTLSPEVLMRRRQLLILAAVLAVPALTAAALTLCAVEAGVQLEGAWEIVSVERNGKNDTKQVGAQMSFALGKVVFEPKAVERSDYLG
jgi:hypothetical protein